MVYKTKTTVENNSKKFNSPYLFSTMQRLRQVILVRM